MSDDSQDAKRWRYCVQFGFPLRAQNDRPGHVWLLFDDPTTGARSGNGNTPVECVDSAMAKMNR